MIDNVRCGFRKWAIGVGNDYEVVVEFGYHPNYGTISLHDASAQDLRNLGEMFLAVARSIEKKIEENKNAK